MWRVVGDITWLLELVKGEKIQLIRLWSKSAHFIFICQIWNFQVGKVSSSKSNFLWRTITVVQAIGKPLSQRSALRRRVFEKLGEFSNFTGIHRGYPENFWSLKLELGTSKFLRTPRELWNFLNKNWIFRLKRKISIANLANQSRTPIKTWDRLSVTTITSISLLLWYRFSAAFY